MIFERTAVNIDGARLCLPALEGLDTFLGTDLQNKSRENS